MKPIFPGKINVPDCALLVVSCDAYADLWPPFFTLLKKHWPDCPFPIFLGTGQEAGPGPANVTLLRSAGGRDWSRCMKDYLDALPHKHVLVMLDDFFLRGPVSTDEILSCLRFAQANQTIQLRLIPRPKPTNPHPNQENIGSCAAGTPYRLSTQGAIWDRMQLYSLLHVGESIWEFEINGNSRADTLTEGFFCVRRPVLPYAGFFAHHVVEKGKWLPHERWIFQRQNIGCDFSRRKSLSWAQTLLYQTIQVTDWLLSLLPLPLTKVIKKWLKTVLNPVLGSQFSRMRGATVQPIHPKN